MYCFIITFKLLLKSSKNQTNKGELKNEQRNSKNGI